MTYGLRIVWILGKIGIVVNVIIRLKQGSVVRELGDQTMSPTSTAQTTCPSPELSESLLLQILSEV